MTEPEPEPDITARAGQLLAAAASLPTEDQIRDMAARAVTIAGTGDMSPGDIRELARQAIDGAEQVTALLRRLAEMLGTDAQPGNAGGGR